MQYLAVDFNNVSYGSAGGHAVYFEIAPIPASAKAPQSRTVPPTGGHNEQDGP